jgi:hypothetical protein
MSRLYVGSGLVLFLAALLVNIPAYAFEKRPSLVIVETEGLDQSLDNSFVFSAAPSNTQDVQVGNNYVKAGVADDGGVLGDWQPGLSYDGALGMAETGFRHFGREQYGVGGWEYTEKPNALTPPDRKSSKGMYVLAERTFYKEDDKNITGFARAGRAAGDLVQSKNGWSAGFVMKGFVKERPEGQLGFAISGGADKAVGRNFAVRRHSSSRRNIETRAELTYLDKLTDDITIQPGLKFTIDPGRDDEDSSTGLTAGIRLHMRLK